MKNMNELRLALTFAGTFLGAGYVSGQELWQFFGAYGANAISGLLLAIAVIFLFGVLLLRLPIIANAEEVDRIVIPWDNRVLRTLVSLMQGIFLFCIAVIMSAGVGALLQQLFSLPHYIGSALFCALIGAAAIYGLQGMVRFFSFVVPVLVIATLYFGVRAALSAPALPSAAVMHSTNPLMGSFVLSALNFSGYNLFGSIAILTPFARYVPDRKCLLRGLGLGCLFLLVIALSVLVSLRIYPDAAAAELPMLALAGRFGAAFGVFYGILLLLGMGGTSLSSIVAFTNFLETKFSPLRAHRKRTVFIVMTLCCAASLCGFSGLIGVVYPIFGYCSFFFLGCVLLHYAKRRRAMQSRP